MKHAAPPVQTLHLVVRGRVQGVFFRDTMRREAQGLGITGWVRNCKDGTVEAVIQGEGTAVEAMRQWARRGPPHARVEQVEVSPIEGDYPDFEIRY